MITTTTVWTVKAGDKLAAIATKVYGDPRLWRPIADANAIDNPLRFPRQSDLGRLIVVPGQQP